MLLVGLLLLIVLSGFFSGAETGLMALNRYRLQHLVRKRDRAALRIHRLLQRPDRILGVILIGNTFANILASAIATMMAVRLWGELGVVLATLLLTLVVLVFAEVTPKTLAALYPRRVAFFVGLPLEYLLRLLYPLVWLVNGIGNGVLRIFGVKVGKRRVDSLSRGELKAVLANMGDKIPESHRRMLLSVLDLEQVAVNDVMVPRHEVVGIDLDQPWSTVVDQLMGSRYTRVLVYQKSLDRLSGFVHSQRVSDLFVHSSLNKNTLLQAMEEPHFIPDGTLLNVQLMNFQRERYRVGLVVDEYGAIQGLITLADILEEIVGTFSTETPDIEQEIQRNQDGSYWVSGNVPIRDLNREMGWELPAAGPNTLSGLIIEQLEMIPEPGVGLRVGGYPVEVVGVGNNKVIKARIWPGLRIRDSV